ncbi:MAG: aminomethyl-transferring glycine dehydrogenase subunit GcvPB [bacterium]|nr:aminomethyl-transferring glycine dehydrogenase subunit GcvPB [bacterium]
MDSKTLFEKSRPGRSGVAVPNYWGAENAEDSSSIPANMRRSAEPALPELSECDVTRHFVGLSQKNFSVDTQFYPLGSCTMKFNPRINEKAAALPGFVSCHPLSPAELCQGSLQLMYELQKYLAEITGMDAVTLQPAAGAHGEVTALFMISRYFHDKGEQRTKVIVPDSSHGTNPASAALAGFQVVTIKSAPDGSIDLEALRANLDSSVACLMLTNPSTLGLFESKIAAVAEMVHEAGGLVYYDGANMNALMGLVRPGDMGFDLVHLNLHKTFSTPHGGGGPGAGPVGACGELAAYLPGPIVRQTKSGYELAAQPHTIGRVRMFWGSFAVLVKAYAYIRSLGAAGLREASEMAVLAANYMRVRLHGRYHVPFDTFCMHEFVMSADQLKAEKGLHATDIAKALLDRGFHAPTIYFPLIVEEALMVEPTETESLETLDAFVEALLEIADEDADSLHECPCNFPVTRLDETKAARKPVLHWTEE